MSHNQAIFLDADGVLNEAIIKNGKPAAPTSLQDLVIPDEVPLALAKLKAAGYLLICVTNKPDIERGLMTQAALDEIIQHLRTTLPLDDIYISYDEHSNTFKPAPGMLLNAVDQYQLDITQCFIIGDRWTDVEAGRRAGCKTVWINRCYPNPKEIPPSPPADFTALSLQESVDWILNKKTTHLYDK